MNKNGLKNAYQYVRENSYFCLSKKITKKIGWSVSGVLSILIDTHNFVQKNNKLVENEWFYKLKQDMLQNLPNINEKTLQKILKKLEDLKYIERKRIKSYNKMYYRLNHRKIGSDCIKCKGLKMHPLQGVKNAPLTQGVKNAPLNNNIYSYNKTKNNYSFYKEYKKKNSVFEKTLNPSNKNLLIEYWNNLDNTPKHKQPNTKVYKEIITYFKYFKSGIILKKIKLNENYMKKNNIPKIKLMKKWTDDQIKEGLLKLSKIFIKGYWPEDKTKINKNLSSLIYNSRTEKSIFLLVYFNDIKIKSNKINITKIFKSNFILSKTDHYNIQYSNKDIESIENDYINYIPIFTKLFTRLFKKELNIYNKKELLNKIIKMINIFENLNLNNSKAIGYQSTATDSKEGLNSITGNPLLFFRKYINWLSEIKYKDFPISVNMIGLDSNNWNDFLIYIKNEYNITQNIPLEVV